MNARSAKDGIRTKSQVKSTDLNAWQMEALTTALSAAIQAGSVEAASGKALLALLEDADRIRATSIRVVPQDWS